MQIGSVRPPCPCRASIMLCSPCCSVLPASSHHATSSLSVFWRTSQVRHYLWATTPARTPASLRLFPQYSSDKVIMLPAGRSKKTKADQMGLSEADQIAMQAALFAKAANAVQVWPSAWLACLVGMQPVGSICLWVQSVCGLLASNEYSDPVQHVHVWPR